MNMKIIGLLTNLMLACFLINLRTGRSANHMEKKISLIHVDGRFVEDEVVTFKCTYNGEKTYMRWYIYDWSGYSTTLIQRKVHAGFKARVLNMPVVMRRDFSLGLVMCNSSDGSTASIKLPMISPTIRYLVSVNPNVAAGRNESVSCDVYNLATTKADIEFFAVLTVTHPRHHASFERLENFETSVIKPGERRRFTFFRKFDLRDNGYLVQCAVMIEPVEEQPHNGTILSRRVPIIVHTFEVTKDTSFPRIVPGGGDTKLSFTAQVNPPPNENLFTVKMEYAHRINFFSFKLHFIKHEKFYFTIYISFEPPNRGYGTLCYFDGNLVKYESKRIRFFEVDVQPMNEKLYCDEGSLAHVEALIVSDEKISLSKEVLSVNLISTDSDIFRNKIIADVVDSRKTFFKVMNEQDLVTKSLSYVVKMKAEAYRTGWYRISVTQNYSVIPSGKFEIITREVAPSTWQAWVSMCFSFTIVIGILGLWAHLKFVNRRRDDLAFMQFKKDFTRTRRSTSEFYR